MRYYLVLGLILTLILSGFGILEVKSFGQGEFTVEKIVPTILYPDLKIEVMVTDLDFPTKMTFIDDETIILVAQKNNGKIIVIKNFEIQAEPALDLYVEGERERGLVGLTSINFEDQILVFVYYTESVKEEDTYVRDTAHTPNENNGTKLVRYTWNGISLVDPVELLHPISYSLPNHQGGAMTILDGQLLLMVGDNKEPGLLINDHQEELYDRGAIFRINFEGEPSPNNPFSEPKLSKYYSYGIRNGYGLTVDPVTNNIWDTENGPHEFDEINLIFPGFNSGWSKIMGPKGQGLFSAKSSDLVLFENAAYSDPEFSWKDTIGVTEIEFLKSNKLGMGLQNDAFVGDVHGRIYHFELNENRDGFEFSEPSLIDLVADTQEEASGIVFAKNLGVITDIKTGPDGFLYVVSLVRGDAPGWEKWIGNLNIPKVVKQGAMNGIMFRIVPNFPLFNQEEIPSLKQQIENSVLPMELKCKESFELIFKIKNNSPACVKPLTAEKLIERGWGTRS